MGVEKNLPNCPWVCSRFLARLEPEPLVFEANCLFSM
jgi:hypothetical protein